jgi:hypothetical protein
MSYYVSIRSEFRVVKSVVISAYNTMFGSSLPPVVCRRAHVLFTLFVLAVVYWCPAHIVLYFCFVFLRLVYPMLSVSLDCPFLKTLSVFFYVYYLCIHSYICLTLCSRGLGSLVFLLSPQAKFGDLLFLHRFLLLLLLLLLLLFIIIITIIIIPLLLLAVNLSDQILRDWCSDLY